MARRCDGPLAEDYAIVKQRADEAVKRGGIEYITNAWSIPEDLMNCGLAYLVERQRGTTPGRTPTSSSSNGATAVSSPTARAATSATMPSPTIGSTMR